MVVGSELRDIGGGRCSQSIDAIPHPVVCRVSHRHTEGSDTKAPKRKQKEDDAHIPEEFWCYVCGKVEKKSDTPRVRLVNREDTNMFPIYRIGDTKLLNPHPAPERHRPTSKVVDGNKKEVSKSGRKLVGYACNAGYQQKAASNLHTSGANAIEAARVSAPSLRSAEAKQQEEKEKELQAQREEHLKLVHDLEKEIKDRDMEMQVTSFGIVVLLC